MHRGHLQVLGIWYRCWVSGLPQGLYKVEYGINGAFGRSVMCMHDGKLLGGNSAFAHLGSYQENGDEIIAEIITQRHNEDPHYKPLMGADVAAIHVRGKTKGNTLTRNILPQPVLRGISALPRFQCSGSNDPSR
jgi:hypothetical protein